MAGIVGVTRKGFETATDEIYLLRSIALRGGWDEQVSMGLNVPPFECSIRENLLLHEV